jgi:hypothetical protein
MYIKECDSDNQYFDAIINHRHNIRFKTQELKPGKFTDAATLYWIIILIQQRNLDQTEIEFISSCPNPPLNQGPKKSC